MGGGASLPATSGPSLPVALPPKPGVSHLRHCTKLTSFSLSGDADVDVTRFLVAGSAFVNFVKSLGGFAHQASNDLRAHLTVVLSSKLEGITSMRVLLEREQALDGDSQKERGSMFVEGSASNGVFWVVVAMRYWEEVCRLRCKLAGVSDPPELKDTLVAAHERVLRE